MNKTLKEIVVDFKLANDYNGATAFLCGLNSDLKAKHFKGLCTDGINVNTEVDVTNKSFANTRNVITAQNVKNDIDSLAVFAISTFVFLSNDTNQFVQLNKNVIVENVDFIKGMVPELVPGDKYYTDIIEGKAFTYYEDYIAALQVNNEYGSSNSNNLAKSYSTAAGRAFSDKNNYDSAFVNIIFYPVIIAAICIISFVVYVTINILK